MDRVNGFAGVFGGESAVAKVGAWLAHHPSLFVAGMVAWAIGASLVLWLKYTASLPRLFTQGWEGTVRHRQVLRDLLPPAYAKWTGTPSSFAVMTRCIEQAGFPEGLPLKTGALRHYAARAEGLWFGERKRLLDFCRALYPVHGESPLLSPDQRTQLYLARALLAQFWDEWGRHCYDEESITEGSLRPRLQAWELTVLAYVELALALRHQERSAGKRGLFRLGRAVSKTSKL